MPEHEQIVTLLRDPAQLPATTDGGEHLITGIHVCDICDDPADSRFVIGFVTATGRTLRVRLPAEQLDELAHVLFSMAKERRWRDEV